MPWTPIDSEYSKDGGDMRIGKCDGCGARSRMVNWAYRTLRMPAGNYCDECYEKFDLEYHRKPTSIAATKDDISPWQENAIRDLEEDR